MRINMMTLFLLCMAYAGTAAELTDMKVVSTEHQAGQGFGVSLSVSGDYAIMGAYLDDNHNGIDAGAAYIFKNSWDVWVKEQKLIARDGKSQDHFGYSSAISGDYALVGAFNAGGTGAVYVFKNNDGNWTQTHKLTSPDSHQNDYFGCSVAFSGVYAVVGAYRNDEKGEDSGAAYIFKNDGGIWSLQTKIKAADGARGDNFGRSVAISDSTVVIGAAGDDNNTGAAYVFERKNDKWLQTAKLTAGNAKPEDFFGFSVSVFGDYAIGGACGADVRGEGSGAAYVFKNTGGVWGPHARLEAGNEYDFMGRSVSMSGDYAIVGAAGDNRYGESSGTAYVFKNTGGSWNLAYALMPGGIETEDRFGWPSAIYHKGPNQFYAAAAAQGDDDTGENAGAVYFFGATASADIDVTPREVIINYFPPARRQQAQPRSDEPDPCSRGLIIPNEVMQYWQKNPSPPALPRTVALPPQINWKQYDSDVKSQGSCGSCAVFAAIALIENLGNRIGLSDQDLSEQAVLACSPALSCFGGWYWDVFKYIHENGAPPEACYPYEGKKGRCTLVCDKPAFLEKIETFTSSPGLWGENHTVDQLKAALQEGPLCVAMRVPNNGTFAGNGYKGGVYNYEGGEISWEGNGHAVLVVGYNDTDQSFLVKNSWGTYWGESGYFRIAYDDVTDDVKFGSYAARISPPYMTGRISTFTIANQGSGELQISDMRASVPWLTFSPPAGFTIMPRGCGKAVTVNAVWERVISPIETGTITIVSNDKDEPVVEVHVTANRFPSVPACDRGDIDGIDCVRLTDAILALQAISGGSHPAVRSDFAGKADINGDGLVGLEEVIYILGRVSE
jgi:C1A family cysteine protease